MPPVPVPRSGSRTAPSPGFRCRARNFTDLIQTSPQVVGTSVAGQNNRYNNLQIDGGVNNDVFGLAEIGSPGGQARARPISVEAIKEFQVLVAPFDVRQGSFTGGLVNTITKSGTNDWSGSIFGYYQDKGIAGYRDDPTFPGLSIGQYGGTPRRPDRPRPAAVLRGRGHSGPGCAVLVERQSHRQRRVGPRARRVHRGRRQPVPRHSGKHVRDHRRRATGHRPSCPTPTSTCSASSAGSSPGWARWS